MKTLIYHYVYQLNWATHHKLNLQLLCCNSIYVTYPTENTDLRIRTQQLIRTTNIIFFAPVVASHNNSFILSNFNNEYIHTKLNTI